MKTQNLIIIGGIGLAAVYLFMMRKRTSESLAALDVPESNENAKEPYDEGRPVKGNNSIGYGVGMVIPTSLNQINQQFKNRVYTKVKDFYGEDANTGLYSDNKKLALYQKIWKKLQEKGVQNPMNATLGEMGPAIREIAQEGFNFAHSKSSLSLSQARSRGMTLNNLFQNKNQRAARTLRGGVASTILGGRRNI